MLRGAGQKHPASDLAAPGSHGRGSHGIGARPLLPRRQGVVERRTGAAKALGFCGWALAGGTAFFAIWELGNFSVLFGNAPLLPAAVHESPTPGTFRPAGESRESGGGCTQAPIDRASGNTVPGDCHTLAPVRGTMLAQL